MSEHSRTKSNIAAQGRAEGTGEQDGSPPRRGAPLFAPNAPLILNDFFCAIDGSPNIVVRLVASLVSGAA